MVESGGGVHHLASYYGHAVNCDVTNPGDLHGDRKEGRFADSETVVGTWGGDLMGVQ